MTEARLHLLGIRHHGPGSARAVLAALDRIDPALLLIEGPPEAEAILALAASPAMRPPLAILAYLADEPGIACFYPFAEYSPEWQALRWAHRHNRPVRFIDLPAGITLARRKAARDAPETDTAPDLAEPHEMREDPLGMLARLAGYEEGESWWNALIEQGAGSTGIFAAIETMMTALRPEPNPQSLYEAQREAQMRLAIAASVAEQDGPLAVICGAWHVPALRRRVKPAEDRALLRGLPKLKPVLTFIPWTDTRLAAGSGYGAGIISPGWYRHLWAEFSRDGRNAPDPQRFTAGWQARIGQFLRENGLPASTASLIESSRLALALAALRGLALPGLAEMRDAAAAALCGGEARILQLIETKLVIGTEIGEIDEAVPQMPLQADLTRLQRQCRLKPSADPEEIALDLRSEAGLARSTLLHRLTLIDVPWGKLLEAGRSRGTFRERWQLAWVPEFSVKLAEALVWGTTLADAAAARGRGLVAASHDAGVLAQTIATALTADLPDIVNAAILRLQEVAALSDDQTPLLTAFPPLAELLRYGAARKLPEAELTALLQQIGLEIATGLARQSRDLEPDSAETRRRQIIAFERALPLIADAAVESAWAEALNRLAHDPAAAPGLRGHAVRRRHDQSLCPQAETEIALSLAMSRAVSPPEAGAWLAGFLGESAGFLILDHGLRAVVDRWLLGLDETGFVESLPLLRRIFGGFDAMERRRLMAALTNPAQDAMIAPAAAESGDDAFAKALPLLSTILGLTR